MGAAVGREAAQAQMPINSRADERDSAPHDHDANIVKDAFQKIGDGRSVPHGFPRALSTDRVAHDALPTRARAPLLLTRAGAVTHMRMHTSQTERTGRQKRTSCPRGCLDCHLEAFKPEPPASSAEPPLQVMHRASGIRR